MLQDMVEEFPDYLDGYVRLACIERKRGNFKKAIQWAEKGIDKAEASNKGSASHTDLLAMAGALCSHACCTVFQVLSGATCMLHVCLSSHTYVLSNTLCIGRLQFMTASVCC